MVKQEMSFKDISVFSFNDHFVQLSGTVFPILVDGIMGNIHMELF